MELAEKAELRIRSDYAFGEAGSAPEIQAGETLRFIVELVGLTPRGGQSPAKLQDGFVMQRSFPEYTLPLPELRDEPVVEAEDDSELK